MQYNPAKVYCVAVGDVVASAATEKARCGDILRITWDDGTWDYMVVSETKGGYELGHTAGVTEYANGKAYTPGCSNALEIVMDRTVKTNDAINLRRQGTIGKWGPNYSDDVCTSTENTRHWSQGFSNIEVLDCNVVPENFAELA